MKAKRPAAGWPWEDPAFRFSIDWPPGFVPQQMKAGELDAFGRSRTAAIAREAQILNGHSGSIIGISDKSDKRMRERIDRSALMVFKAKRP